MKELSSAAQAKAQYERILGKALMGRGPPAEHWAHSEYAWLVFEDGDLEVGRTGEVAGSCLWLAAAGSSVQQCCCFLPDRV